ncbi:MAG: hypothetical protein FJY29_11270 [Betaproteobacteria bacterium]|nr:hypothetical protein [Betaproteobacteria bacterium]
MWLKSLTGVCSILLLVASLGCVTTEAPPEAVVLERSERGRPKWVTQLNEVEPRSEKWFTYEKSEIQRLDLGIRQTQSSALAAHCPILAARMRTEVDSAVGEWVEANKKNETAKKSEERKKNPLSPEGQKAIDAALEQLGKSDSCPELELKDVYWELLRKPSPNGSRTSYSVYVLLRLNLDGFDDVLALVVDSLKLSGQAEVQPVAEILRARMSNSSQKGTNE